MLTYYFNLLVNLVGTHNGSVFDSRNSLEFFLDDVNSVEGVPLSVLMHLRIFQLGEKSTLLLDPEYGFGEVGNESFQIPPDARLAYVVHLLHFYNVSCPVEGLHVFKFVILFS